MSRENPLWGAPSIHDELLKLGIDLGNSNVAKYIVRRRKPPSRTWRTFLENHVKSMNKVLTNLGVRALRMPVRAPKGELDVLRLGVSLRRECLDFLILFSEWHLQMTVRDWTTHYNRGRPHSALGPGLPEPMSDQVPPNEHPHRLPVGHRVVSSLLGGLHHEYGLMKTAA